MDTGESIDPITRMIACKKSIYENLRFVARPLHTRRHRFQQDLNYDKRCVQYERSMVKIRERLQDAMDLLFEKYRDPDVYEKLAHDFREMLHFFKENYEISDANLIFAVRCITIPVVAIIKDDYRIGRRRDATQQLKKHYLKKLLRVHISGCDGVRKVDGKKVKNRSQVEIEPQKPEEIIRANEIILEGGRSKAPEHNMDSLTVEILRVLIDEIFKLSATLERFCIVTHAHYLLNVMCIFDTIEEFFDSIKMPLDSESTGDSGTRNDLIELIEAVDEYERKLHDYGVSIGLDSPCELFKDIDNLINQLSLLKLLIRRRIRRNSF